MFQFALVFATNCYSMKCLNCPVMKYQFFFLLKSLWQYCMHLYGHANN